MRWHEMGSTTRRIMLGRREPGAATIDARGALQYGTLHWAVVRGCWRSTYGTEYSIGHTSLTILSYIGQAHRYVPPMPPIQYPTLDIHRCGRNAVHSRERARLPIHCPMQALRSDSDMPAQWATKQRPVAASSLMLPPCGLDFSHGLPWKCCFGRIRGKSHCSSASVEWHRQNRMHAWTLNTNVAHELRLEDHDLAGSTSPDAVTIPG